MTTVEKPNDAALAFEANAEYIAQILEEALSRLQIEHTQKEKVKTALGLAYQELAAQSQQLRDENTEKNQKIHELAQLQQVLQEEVDEKNQKIDQIRELHEQEKESQGKLDDVNRQLKKYKDEETLNRLCPVCDAVPCNVAFIPCGHLFCDKCINKWLKTPIYENGRMIGLHSSCPDCRAAKGPPLLKPFEEDGEKWDACLIKIQRTLTRKQYVAAHPDEFPEEFQDDAAAAGS
jgi:hypothetical protein